jgi:hypothetical protein
MPAAPIILVTTGHPTLHQHPGADGEAVHPRLGRLLQPRHVSSVEQTAAAGIPWACDNDCFQGLNPEAFVKMLDRVALLPGCLFVTVPDVVGDAHATAIAFEKWAPALERRGLPVALVLQDGVEVGPLRAWLQRTWHRLDAVFIGGTTEWKEGPAAAELAREAKSRGKWVHWGRVNTRRRFDLIVASGAADSFDGSKWARFRKTYLDGGLAWLDEALDAAELAGDAPAALLDELRIASALRLDAQRACLDELELARGDRDVVVDLDALRAARRSDLEAAA